MISWNDTKDTHTNAESISTTVTTTIQVSFYYTLISNLYYLIFVNFLFSMYLIIFINTSSQILKINALIKTTLPSF